MHNGLIEQGIAGTNIQQKIYEIKINKATPITSGLYNGKTVEELKDGAGLAAEVIVPVTKNLFFDLRANNWTYEKAEGLAVINDSTIAVCNDNDFGQLSVLEDGTAIENNEKSHLYVYHLTGANKIKNFVANTNTISSVPTAIEPTVELASSAIYPNPAYDVINISIADAAQALVRIYNQNGVMVKLANVDGSATLDISELNSGIYFVNIVTDSTSETMKFIKK